MPTLTNLFAHSHIALSPVCQLFNLPVGTHMIASSLCRCWDLNLKCTPHTYHHRFICFDTWSPDRSAA